MDERLASAIELEKKARAALAEHEETRDDARRALEEARRAVEESERMRIEAKTMVEEYTLRLRQTREALMPNEAADKRARTELEAANHDYEEARDLREAMEADLRAAEDERDSCEERLAEAKHSQELAGIAERTSRNELDERVQRATDAQRALDAATMAAANALEEQQRAQRKLEVQRVRDTNLPIDDARLARRVDECTANLDKAIERSHEAAGILERMRERLTAAEEVASKARASYETAQENMRCAIAAADRAEEKKRRFEQVIGLNDTEQEERLRSEALEAYATAEDLRNAAMEVNKGALTELADADVEAIRIRIACEQASRDLDVANAYRARVERELREAREAIEAADRMRTESAERVRMLEEAWVSARENTARLEQAREDAVRENQEAQQGLREVQDFAVRSGQATRSAAGTLDECRHALSEAVASVELARTDVHAAQGIEETKLLRLEAARDVAARCAQVLDEAHAFIEKAERRIVEQRQVVADCEERSAELLVAVRDADEALSAAQRECDIARSDLTEAEVSVIMAEIDSRH